MQTRRFMNRREAGRALASHLLQYANQENVVVLALPRGGVPVAYEVARALNAPLDVLIVRKLGTPGHEELAMGAIASGGARVLNPEITMALRIDRETLERVVAQERAELRRREETYRQGRPMLDVAGCTVILVDDGAATGATMRAAVLAVKQLRPAEVIAAVPAAAPQTCREFEDEADAVVCVITPREFVGVGQWYVEFEQTSDEEVRALLHEAARAVRER